MFPIENKTDRGSEVYKILLAMSEHKIEITESIVIEITKIVCNYQDNANLIDNIANMITPILEKSRKDENENGEI